MSQDLKRLFETHKEAILAILKDHEFVGDCMTEIEAALDNLDNELQNYVFDRPEQTEEEITLESVMNFIENSEPDDDFKILEMLRKRGSYIIEAKNMNEQQRIDKFIEELSQNPYTP